jgi:two-component system, OmpR family, sensor kinase
VIQDERPAGAASSPLNTVSLRLRVTAAVMIVLAVMLILLSIAVTAIFIAQSNRNLNALLAGQAQLARQLARSGAGPRQIVNRVQAGGVEAHLVLRNPD